MKFLILNVISLLFVFNCFSDEVEISNFYPGGRSVYEDVEVLGNVYYEDAESNEDTGNLYVDSIRFESVNTYPSDPKPGDMIFFSGNQRQRLMYYSYGRWEEVLFFPRITVFIKVGYYDEPGGNLKIYTGDNISPVTIQSGQETDWLPLVLQPIVYDIELRDCGQIHFSRLCGVGGCDLSILGWGNGASDGKSERIVVQIQVPGEVVDNISYECFSGNSVCTVTGSTFSGDRKINDCASACSCVDYDGDGEADSCGGCAYTPFTYFIYNFPY